MAFDKRESYTPNLDLRARLMRSRATAHTCVVGFSLILFGGSALASPPPPAPPISGIVRHLERPIAGALVVFYNLGDTSLTRSRTASDGTFVLASAPVGVYDLIAYKRGFVPALVRFWHQGQVEGVSSVRIQLAARGSTLASPAAAESLWELRDRLPADVLREIAIEEGIGQAQSQPQPQSPSATSSQAPGKPGDATRIDHSMGGEVRTVANVGSADTSLSRTAVGVRGDLPNGWQYDLRGDYAAVSENSVASESTPNTGNVAGLALDVATSPEDHLTLRTRRHTLSFRDDRPASFQSHGVSWRRDGEEGAAEWVAARYIEETNLYRATSSGTTFFPVASRTWEVKGHYERPAGDNPGVAVAMTYRHREGTVGPTGIGSDGAFLLSAPDADLSATASARLSSRAQVEGGVIARYLSGGYGIAPVAAVRYDLGKQTTAFVRGLLRARESGTGNATAFPLVVSIEESTEATSRKGFTVGIERRDGNGSLLRMEASNQRVSEAIRAFFEGDFLTEFDSVYLFDGNLVRQYQAVATRRLTQNVSGTMSLRYGSIDSDIAPESASGYGISSNKGRFWSARAAVEVLSTRTGVAVVVRGARQKLDTPAALRSNDSDKVAVSVAQDLSVVGITPFGAVWKLLIALESARTTATTERDEAVATKRLLGGVAISF
jgi:hypothetical protein